MLRGILFLLAIILNLPSEAQQTLLSDQGLTITAKSVKTATGKKRDTWQITITTTTTADQIYFTVAKTGNPIADLSPPRYAAITIANNTGLFAPKVRYLSGEKDGRLALGNAMVYRVPPSVTEVFEAEVPASSDPALQASLLVSLKTETQVSFIRASEQETFTGTAPNRLMFIYVQKDSMMPRRERMLWCVSNDKKKPAVIVADGKFLTVQNGQEGSVADKAAVYGWDDKPFYIRIAGSGFDVSGDSIFNVVRHLSSIHVKDGENSNVIVTIELPVRNTLAFDISVPASSLPVSLNGRYALRIINGALCLVDTSSPSPLLWSSAGIGNPSGFTVVAGNETVTVRITAMPDQKGTGDHAAKFLTVTDDGHVVFFNREGFAVWKS